jgi:GNAT superfamily N-acetyltransferase
MSTDLNPSAQCYIGYFENNPVCFFAVLHFPHPKVKNFKKGHRLVVLPDYQGLGIGHIFSSEIAKKYVEQGNRFIITSSTKSLFKQRKSDKNWIISYHGRKGKANGVLKNTTSENKLTYSYEYIGQPHGKS